MLTRALRCRQFEAKIFCGQLQFRYCGTQISDFGLGKGGRDRKAHLGLGFGIAFELTLFKLRSLWQEADELTRIMAASGRKPHPCAEHPELYPRVRDYKPPDPEFALALKEFGLP
jgi:hypothetical protein